VVPISNSKIRKAKKARKEREFLEALIEQYEFIKSSCETYDKGVEAEAKRLATHIRILVHDTSRSKSLLALMGIKDKIEFLSTASPEPSLPVENLLPEARLVTIRSWAKNGDGGAKYEPILDEKIPGHPWRALIFKDWWYEIVIDDKKNKFCRKDLVLEVANKDGGAHIAPELDEVYYKLTRENSMGWKFSNGKFEKNFENSPVLPSIRQIAFEMLKTLERYFDSKKILFKP